MPPAPGGGRGCWAAICYSITAARPSVKGNFGDGAPLSMFHVKHGKRSFFIFPSKTVEIRSGG